MNRLDQLRKNYQRVCTLPWDRNIAGPQRVWFVVYDKEDERRLRYRMALFEEATVQSGHTWAAIDLTNAFADWLCGPDNAPYAESYFESPELLDDAVLGDFRRAVADRVTTILSSPDHAEDAVLAIHGVAALFGFLRVSELLAKVEGRVRGRLLVFFPGAYEQDNYRLLDARDGWNYHAVPITPSEGELRP